MEKLIELLNEWQEKRLGKAGAKYLMFDGINKVFRLNNGCSLCQELVLSHRFCFVKWLVENDKIDCDKSIFTVNGDYGRDDVISEIERQNYYILNEQYGVNFTDCILMLLSISDTPIDDLISYLR